MTQPDRGKMKPDEWLARWVVTAKERDEEGDWIVFKYQVSAPTADERDILSGGMKNMAAFYFQCIAAGMSSEAASKTTADVYVTAAEKVLGKADK